MLIRNQWHWLFAFALLHTLVAEPLFAQGDPGGEFGLGKPNNAVPAGANGVGQDKVNLLGERIREQQLVAVEDKPESTHFSKRVISMLEKNVEIHLTEQEVSKGIEAAQKELLKTKQDYEGIPTKVERAAANLLALNIEIARLRPNLMNPNNNPLIPKLRQCQLQAQALEAELELLQRDYKNLPIEIRNKDATVQTLAVRLRAFDHDYLAQAKTWTQLLSVFERVSKSEAQRILEACELKQDAYPGLVTIAAMKGLARIHMQQYDLASQDLNALLKQIGAARSRSIDTIRLRTLVALAWTELQMDHYDEAAVHLATAGKMLPNDYELLVCEGILKTSQGKAKEAANALGRAIKVDRKRQEAHRYKAELIIESKIVPIEQAIEAAEIACQLDTGGDYRNPLVLAKAQLAAGDRAAAKKSLDKAIELADTSAEEELAAFAEKLNAAP